MMELYQVTIIAVVYHIGNYMCDINLQKDEHDQDTIDGFEGLEHVDLIIYRDTE